MASKFFFALLAIVAILSANAAHVSSTNQAQSSSLSYKERSVEDVASEMDGNSQLLSVSRAFTCAQEARFTTCLRGCLANSMTKKAAIKCITRCARRFC